MISPTRISIFVKSSNVTSSFIGGNLLFACVADSNFATCSSILFSSILLKSNSALLITWPVFIKSSCPAACHFNKSIPSIDASLALVKGKNGSNTIVRLAVICSAIFIIVLTRSPSVLINFQGSVSAKYLFPKRAKLIASACASLKR